MDNTHIKKKKRNLHQSLISPSLLLAIIHYLVSLKRAANGSHLLKLQDFRFTQMGIWFTITLELDLALAGSSCCACFKSIWIYRIIQYTGWVAIFGWFHTVPLIGNKVHHSPEKTSSMHVYIYIEVRNEIKSASTAKNFVQFSIPSEQYQNINPRWSAPLPLT